MASQRAPDLASQRAGTKRRRLSWVDVAMVAGVLIALVLVLQGLAAVDWDAVGQELADASWGRVLLGVGVYAFVPMAWATALMGCVAVDLDLFPTTLVQLSCSFLNLVTPNGIGGTALQIDYLHKQGVPLASGGSAMVLSSGVGGVISVILLVIAAALTATSEEFTRSDGSLELWAIAVVAAAIGFVVVGRRIRGKIIAAAVRAWHDIRAALRDPRKGSQLILGNLAGVLLYPVVLSIVCGAFGEHLGFAEVVVVQIGAGMLGTVAPVPGGIGVQQAALTGGLMTFGLGTDVSLAIALVFRAVTFLLPALAGIFTLSRLRRAGVV